MRSTLHLPPLDRGSRVPLFAQLATAIADQIRAGRLTGGDVLPGSRSLARALDVGRDTVLAAYADLEAQGLLTARPRTGMVVAELPAGRRGRARGVASTPGFTLDAGPPDLIPPPVPPNTIALATGLPDLRLVPRELIARAYRRAMRASVFGYTSTTTGHPRLRQAIGRLARDGRGIAASEGNVMVTRGSQMALDLVARALIRRGEVACVEDLGYDPAWATFRRAGARLVGVPVDAAGLDVDALARICARTPVRLVYVTPHHQFPTTVVLGPARRIQLLALARKHRFAIIEDDYDHEFAYEGRPVLPLASMDTSGMVVYVGTLSKVLAPGLRIGFVIAPAALIDRLARERYVLDRQGDHALELAIAELIEDDELGRHIRKMRRIYHARRDVLVDALRRQLGDRLTFHVPNGGMALWATVAPSLDVTRWHARALAAGVMFQDGAGFVLSRRRINAARFGFASCTEAEIATAVRRLAAAIRP